ncbi:MAG: cation transporter [Gammaproteobacteria bacterium]|nr:cation transporter [Gammaproteobacteria bacterium]
MSQHAHDHQVHAPDHDHHQHFNLQNRRAFIFALILNGGFVIVELAFGIFAHSLALIADAIHNFGDVLGLMLAWAALHFAQRKATARFTYGFGSATILAALVNAILLILVACGIAWEALHRMQQPIAVNTSVMMAVAGIGIVINAATAWLFVARQHEDINIKGVYLHMVADALVSVGVVLTGIGIAFTAWQWLDPAISVLIAVVIIGSTWSLLRDAVRMALHAAPNNIDVEEVRAYLQSLPGVAQVHDLHVWPISTTITALTAHLLIPEGKTSDAFLLNTAATIKQKFGIGHSTLQIETSSTTEHMCHSWDADN